jgi:hypothetical protein
MTHYFHSSTRTFKKLRNLTLASLILIIGLCSLTFSCTKGTRPKNEINRLPQTDTLIGRKQITNEIAGSAFRKRAESYFLILNNDTSDFQPIFTESKEGNRISIDLRFEMKTRSYKQRMTELKKILPIAAKDFDLDSLRSIFMGRLVSSGDLAIEVTNQYRQKFGKDEKISDYEKFNQFLKESKLATDLNEVLKAYSVSVDKIYPEHSFFTTKLDLISSSKIETDSMNIPNSILDCLIWIELERTNQ